MFEKRPIISPEQVVIDTQRQYNPTHPEVGEIEAAPYYSLARARLYDYAVDGRNLWKSEIDFLKPFFKGGPKRVLEVGFGSGAFLTDLEEETGNQGLMIGIDINAGYVDSAQLLAETRGSKVRFEHGNAYDLEAKDEFDVVIANYVGHHAPDPVGLLAKLAAAVKPGGLLVAASRSEGNQAKLIEHAGISAHELGVSEPKSPYPHCDIKATRYILKMLRYSTGQPAIKLLRTGRLLQQDCDLAIPLHHREEEEDEEGWLDWRQALLSERPYMHNEEGRMPSGEALQQVIDRKLKHLFLDEYFQREQSTGKGFVKDRVIQAVTVGIKQEKRKRFIRRVHSKMAA